jgi:abequosyltransferase
VSLPLISICVPTHDGRRATLAQLLDSIASQGADVAGAIEVCVSDNASRDGTVELVAEERARRAYPIAYRRQPENVGMARNLLAAVDLARGEYCWLLGSDDLLAPCALVRACALIAALPDATGHVTGSIYVDADHPDLRSRQLLRAFHPSGDRPRLVQGLDAVLEQCGNAFTGICWNIVHREAWGRAVASHGERALAHPVWPQVVLLGAMARERPRWGWLAEPLVHQRNADPFLFERESVALADRWTELVGGLARAWGAVLGRGTRRWRARMRRLHAVWGSADDARATRLYERPPRRALARLALSWFGAFWPVPAYWRDVLPATLSPTPLTRVRYGADATRLAAGRPLSRETDHLLLSGDLPDRITPGGVASVELTVRNLGADRVVAAGPHAVRLGQRWLAEDGTELSWDALGVNALGRYPSSLPRPVRPGHAIRAEVVLYAPRDPGEYRVAIRGHQHNVGWLDAVGTAPPLTGRVTVAP